MDYRIKKPITEIVWLKFEDCIVYFRSKDETICFYVKKKGGAIPQKVAVENENEYLYPQTTCQEAVWDDFE